MAKILPKNPDFKEIKYPIKVRDIHKTEKKKSISISVFGYENEEKHQVFVSRKCCVKNMLIYY